MNETPSNPSSGRAHLKTHAAFQVCANLTQRLILRLRLSPTQEPWHCWRRRCTTISPDTFGSAKPVKVRATNIKTLLHSFENSSWSCSSLLVGFLITCCSRRRSNCFWSHCCFKEPGKLLANKALNKCSVQKHIWGHFTALRETKTEMKSRLMVP